MKITPAGVALLGFVSVGVGGGLLWGYGSTLMWVGVLMLLWAFLWMVGF